MKLIYEAYTIKCEACSIWYEAYTFELCALKCRLQFNDFVLAICFWLPLFQTLSWLLLRVMKWQNTLCVLYIFLLLIVAVTFWHGRDCDTCQCSLKGKHDAWPPQEHLIQSLHPVWIPSRSGN